jgi:hypothetical protein
MAVERFPRSLFRICPPKIREGVDPTVVQQLELQVAEMFRDTVFSRSSDECLELREALHTKSDILKGFVLQSAREAYAWRVACSDEEEGKEGYVTRTAVLYFKSNGSWYVAVDDIPDPKKNLILTHTFEEFDEYFDQCFLKKSHPLVRSALGRAKRSGRVVKVPNKKEWNTKLSTVPNRRGTSQFGRFSLNKLVFGDMSEVVAKYWHSLGRESCEVRGISVESLETQLIPRGSVEVQSLSVDSLKYLRRGRNVCDAYDDSNSCYYIQSFCIDGYARGVLKLQI